MRGAMSALPGTEEMNLARAFSDRSVTGSAGRVPEGDNMPYAASKAKLARSPNRLFAMVAVIAAGLAGWDIDNTWVANALWLFLIFLGCSWLAGSSFTAYRDKGEGPRG